MDEQINRQKIKLISIEELPFVMEIINDAKKLLSKDSLQWQQGYPNETTMTNDINNSYLYIFTEEAFR